MSFAYVDVEQAMQRPGLRMVVGGGVPSPWGEAAKGILHVKGLDWCAVRLDYASEALSAVDIYAATAMAMFSPLPQERCEMDLATRAVFETLDEPTREALSPDLLAHRDMMYARHLALPLSL